MANKYYPKKKNLASLALPNMMLTDHPQSHLPSHMPVVPCKGGGGGCLGVGPSQNAPWNTCLTLAQRHQKPHKTRTRRHILEEGQLGLEMCRDSLKKIIPNQAHLFSL